MLGSKEEARKRDISDEMLEYSSVLYKTLQKDPDVFMKNSLSYVAEKVLKRK